MCYLAPMLNLRNLPFIALFAALPVWADIYKHVDANGNVTFTNTPTKGAQRVLIESPHTSRSATPKTRSDSKAQAATPSPANFPKVSSGTQKERDISRRRILEEELAAETRQLAGQKKELSEAETNRSAEERNSPNKFLERIGRLRENLVLHEKNIAALQKELAKLR